MAAWIVMYESFDILTLYIKIRLAPARSLTSSIPAIPPRAYALSYI